MNQGIFFVIVLFTDESAPLGFTVKHAPTRTRCKGKVRVAFADGARSMHNLSVIQD